MTSFETLWQIFGDVLIALWFGLTVFAALVGFWAFMFPSSFIRFNQRISIWVTLDNKGNEKKKPIFIERPFYRYHVMTGLVLIIAAIYVLYEVIFNLKPGEIEGVLSKGSDAENIWLGILVDAAFGWIYISGIVALIMGALIVIRPSYLKGIEQRMNYWVETDKISRSLDKRHQILDEWASAHPRFFGIISLLGSVIVAWSLFNYGYLA